MLKKVSLLTCLLNTTLNQPGKPPSSENARTFVLQHQLKHGLVMMF